jgi:YggT family protein
VGWLILYYTLEVLKWLVVARAVVSWFASPHSRHPAIEMLRRVTDPVLLPIRSVIPGAGAIDISPLVAFFLIILLQGMIARLALF